MSHHSKTTYIARVRYRNDLPPPPGAPRLLDIPVSLDKYTSPSFTSNLLREKAPIFELDNELGMPLDLSLIPGVFEQDESGK